MTLKINNASPVLHKDKDFKFSVKVWNVSGKVIPDCNCASLAKDFDIYVPCDKLVIDKLEMYMLTKRVLKADGKIV